MQINLPITITIPSVRVLYIAPRQENNKIAIHMNESRVCQDVRRAINAWLYQGEGKP